THSRRRTHRDRDESGPPRHGQAEPLSRRPVLPAERVPRDVAAAARAAWGHLDARRSLRRDLRSSSGEADSAHFRRGDEGAPGLRLAGQHPRTPEFHPALRYPEHGRRTACADRGDPGTSGRWRADARRRQPGPYPRGPSPHQWRHRRTRWRGGAPWPQEDDAHREDEEAGRIPREGPLWRRAGRRERRSATARGTWSRLTSSQVVQAVRSARSALYLGGEYGSGVPSSIGGFFFRLSENSATIFVTGATTHELYQGNPSGSSFRSVRRLMTFGSGRVNGGSYMFSCQMKCTFQFRHLTADNRSAT